MLSFGSLSMERPDQTKEERETQSIYLYSLWFCVLRPRHSDPGWIFQLGMKTDGWLSTDTLKGTLGLMSDPYVLIECKRFKCGSAQNP